MYGLIFVSFFWGGDQCRKVIHCLHFLPVSTGVISKTRPVVCAMKRQSPGGQNRGVRPSLILRQTRAINKAGPSHLPPAAPAGDECCPDVLGSASCKHRRRQRRRALFTGEQLDSVSCRWVGRVGGREGVPQGPGSPCYPFN